MPRKDKEVVRDMVVHIFVIDNRYVGARCEASILKRININDIGQDGGIYIAELQKNVSLG